MSGHDVLALAEWQRIRRYAVPQQMITECTGARERGDWRAACAAGRIDVDLTDAQVAAAADALAGFAPDLLRWHLPRALGGHTTLATRTVDDHPLHYALRTREPLTEDSVVLVVDAPVSILGSQRLTLRAVPAVDAEELRRSHPVPPHLWDARRAGDLRAAVSGARERMPRPLPDDGALVPEEAFGVRVDVPAPDTSEAWARAGLPVTVQAEQWWPDSAERLRHIDPVLLAREVREAAEWFDEPSWALWSDDEWVLRFDVDGDTVHATLLTSLGGELEDLPRLHHQLMRHPVDAELVRHGRLTPGDLHPLVRAALFPSAGTPARPVPAATAGPLRVRCAGVWHEIEVRSGRLVLTAHTTAEQQRERAMRAFGGAVTGCFAVEQTWNGTPGRLPRRLRAHREDLWQRMLHGGTRTVLELLDAGMDPHLRDSRGRTLLHRARSFDHRVLLPRLLAEGLDVNARDLEGSTPLYLAVVFQAPGDLIIALADAGADVHATNQDDMSVVDYLDDVLAYREDTELEPGFAAAVGYLRDRA